MYICVAFAPNFKEQGFHVTDMFQCYSLFSAKSPFLLLYVQRSSTRKQWEFDAENLLNYSYGHLTYV